MSSPSSHPLQVTIGPAPGALSRAQLLYVWLTALSVMCLLVADLLGSKLFQFQLPFSLFGLRSIEHTCGMLTFPVTFLITDWLNDYYGKRAARRVVIVSFSMALLAFGVVQVALAMPFWSVPFNVTPDSFNSIFGSASVMVIASISAYLVNNLADIAIFGLFKRLTRGKMIWLRATGSTIISQMIDSFVVTWLAFWFFRRLIPNSGEPMDLATVLKTAATGYTLKFIIAVVLTPVLYLGHGMIHRYTGLAPLPPDQH